MWPFSKKQEVIQEDFGVLGQPIDIFKSLGWINQPIFPLITRDVWSTKMATIRNLPGHDAIRQLSRILWETNPYAAGAIDTLRRFAIGEGLKYKISHENESTREAIEKYLEEFDEYNKITSKQGECYQRCHVEGEAFLHLVYDYDDETQGRVRITFIEPDMVRAPNGEEYGEWSGGVRAPVFDPTNVMEFNIQWQEGNETKNITLTPEVLKHCKLNVKENIKRGIGSLVQVIDDLFELDRLRKICRRSEQVRESIAYFKEFDKASADTVRSLEQSLKNSTKWQYDAVNGATQVDVHTIEPGTSVAIPKGLTVKPPPDSINSAASTEILLQGLRACACRLGVPEWVFTGSVEASSYASSLMPDSLFTKKIAHDQQIQCQYWAEVYEQVIELAAAAGDLPADAVEAEISVQAPSPHARGKNDENNTYAMLNRAGIMSLHTWATLNNLDLDREIAIIETEKEMGLVPAQVIDEKPTDPKSASGQLNKDTGDNNENIK